MKQTIALLLALLIPVLLIGCGQEDKPAAESSEQAPANSEQTESAETSSASLAPAESSEQTESSTPEESADPAESSASEESTTSPLGGSYTFDHITLTLPNGFLAEESGSVTLVHHITYPDIADNITLSKAGADKAENYTKDLFDRIYAQTFQNFEGVQSFEQMKFGELDEIVMSYHITQNGVPMTQTQYLIFCPDSLDIVTFTSVSGEYDEAFAACVESMEYTE